MMELQHTRRCPSPVMGNEDCLADAQNFDAEAAEREIAVVKNTTKLSKVGLNESDSLDSLYEHDVLSIDSIAEIKISQWHGNERKRWWKLYTLHFLFMWNARTYEYASIILVSLAFPSSLFAPSIRGFVSTLSTMLFSSAVGSWIDRSPSRLRPLLMSISSSHGAIVVSYLCWLIWPLIVGHEADGDPGSQTIVTRFWKSALFGVVLLMDVIHDVAATCNLLSLQRDWIPVLAVPEQCLTFPSRFQYLIYTDAAPSLLPLIVRSFNSRATWIVLLAVVAALFCALEVSIAYSFFIAEENEELRVPKLPLNDEGTTQDNVRYAYGPSWIRKLYVVLYQDPGIQLKQYFSTPAWPASMAISILQLSVLAYSSTFITYSLEAGYSLSTVTIARGTGTLMGLVGTFITPLAATCLTRRWSRSQRMSGAEIERRVLRKIGLWGVVSQFLMAIPVVGLLWMISPGTPLDITQRTLAPPHILISIPLFSFLSLSRVGHWMFYLMVQEIEQVEVASSQRSTFGGTEQSFRSFFELCHWGATMIWSRPEDFKILSLGNLMILALGATIYVWWQGKEMESESLARYEEVAMNDFRPTEDEQDY